MDVLISSILNDNKKIIMEIILVIITLWFIDMK